MNEERTVSDRTPIQRTSDAVVSTVRTVSDRTALAARSTGILDAVQQFAAPSRGDTTAQSPARTVSDRSALSGRSAGVLATIANALVPSVAGNGTAPSLIPNSGVTSSGDSALDSLIDLFGRAFGYDAPSPQSPSVVSVPTGSSGGSNILLYAFGIGLIGFIVYWFYYRKKGGQNVQ